VVQACGTTYLDKNQSIALSR